MSISVNMVILRGYVVLPKGVALLSVLSCPQLQW